MIFIPFLNKRCDTQEKSFPRSQVHACLLAMRKFTGSVNEAANYTNPLTEGRTNSYVPSILTPYAYIHTYTLLYDIYLFSLLFNVVTSLIGRFRGIYPSPRSLANYSFASHRNNCRNNHLRNIHRSRFPGRSNLHLVSVRPPQSESL